MKKLLLASVAVLIVAAGAGGWYVLQHRDPMQQAKVSLGKGDMRAASLQLKTAVREQPNNAEARALLAQVLLTEDDPIAAEREIKRAMDLHWDRSQGLATLAQAYLREQKWPEIMSEIPDHGANNDQSAYFLMIRAIAEFQLGKKAESTASLQKALSLSPRNAEVHLAAARLAYQDGKRPEALAEADRTITLDPQRVDAYQLKALTELGDGHRDAALATLTKALEIAPNRDDVRAQRASMLVMANDNAKAKTDVDELMSRSKPMPLAKYLQSILLIRDKKFAEADSLMQQIDPFLSQLPRGLYFKAIAKSETGQQAQAEDAIDAYVTANRKDADAVRLLAVIDIKSDHPERAIPYLVSAVDHGISDAQTLDLLGRVYALSGKNDAAQQIFAEAAKVTQSPEELTRLASARLQVGDLTGAVGDLQRAAETASPNQTSAREALVATSIRLGELDRAQEELDALRRDSGETEAVGILTGLLDIARLEPEAAQQAFADTAKRFPNSVTARMNDARVLIQLRRPDEALTVLKELLDKDPARGDALTLAVQILMVGNRSDEAVALAEKARKAKPDDLGIINGEAQLLGRLRQFDRAIEVITSAKKDGKIPSPLLATLGSLQFAAGKVDAAKQSFADLVAAEPRNVGAALAQADLLTRTKDFGTERRVLDDAITRMPGSLPLLEARVRVDLLDGGVDQALQTARSLSSNPANMPAAAVLRGGVLMGAHRYTDAVDAFQTEYLHAPSAALAIALAEAKQAAGDVPGGIDTLTKYQGSHPDDAAVAQALAGLEIADHQLDLAERNLQIVLRQQASNVVALNNLAWVLQQKGDKQARQYAQRAFEISPTPDVTDTLGWILVQQGDSKTAAGLLQNASAAAPNNPAIRYHLAVALKNLGREKEAIEVLRPAAESPNSFEDKDAAQKLMTELTQPSK